MIVTAVMLITITLNAENPLLDQLPSTWLEDVKTNYSGLSTLLNKPLPTEWLTNVHAKYTQSAQHKQHINTITKHLQTPDGPKKQQQENFAIKLFLKDYLERTPQELILFLLFGIKGHNNETLADYIQRNAKLLELIKNVDSIKKLDKALHQ